MNQQLTEETERLQRSWAGLPEEKLRDYLVAGIHDPRINPQSIHGRHFLIEAMFGERYAVLQEEELRFGTVMKWLMDVARQGTTPDDWRAVEHALERGADNAEGTPIPPHVSRAFSMLPRDANGVAIPNYLRDTIRASQRGDGAAVAIQETMNLFARLWNCILGEERPPKISVIEPACGSANDYRALAACGLTRHLDYVGFDLCEKNVANARAMFPGARFEVGNVFKIDHPDRSFDWCVVHDLLEHLSPEGLELAIAELCRVPRRGIFIGFFQMHEEHEHIVRPVDDYHWNTLSLPRVRSFFEHHGGQTQAIHINTWLRYRFACDEKVYYDTAYDLLCWFER